MFYNSLCYWLLLLFASDKRCRQLTKPYTKWQGLNVCHRLMHETTTLVKYLINVRGCMWRNCRNSKQSDMCPNWIVFVVVSGSSQKRRFGWTLAMWGCLQRCISHQETCIVLRKRIGNCWKFYRPKPLSTYSLMIRIFRITTLRSTTKTRPSSTTSAISSGNIKPRRIRDFFLIPSNH